MSKTNIDNIVQDKLQDLNYDFKPEYWDKMENMLNASTLSSSTNAATTTFLGSKIFLISISSVVLIAGAIGSYFIFNSNSENSNDIISNSVNQIVLNEEQSENIINLNNTKVISQTADRSIAANNTSSKVVDKSEIENANIKSSKSYAVVSVEEIDSSIEDASNINSINNSISVNNSNSNNSIIIATSDSNCIPCEETNIKEIDVVLMEDSNLEEIEKNEEEDDGIYVVSKLNLIEKADEKEKSVAIDTSREKQQEKIDETKVKNVKPMRKPSGRVFRKKGGLLKRFGF